MTHIVEMSYSLLEFSIQFICLFSQNIQFFTEYYEFHQFNRMVETKRVFWLLLFLWNNTHDGLNARLNVNIPSWSNKTTQRLQSYMRGTVHKPEKNNKINCSAIKFIYLFVK